MAYAKYISIACDQLAHLVLSLSTERTADLIVNSARHIHTSLPSSMSRTLVLGNHCVNDAVLYSLLSSHIIVSLSISLDNFQRLACVGCQNLVQFLLGL